MQPGPDSSSTAGFHVDTGRSNVGRGPASVAENPRAIRGNAMVYCPAKMIKEVPAIISAVITKEELSAAVAKFAEDVQDENPDVQKEAIEKGIRTDSIDIYQHMGVSIEFDPDDFKQISRDDNHTQDFTNKNTLEWEWTLKPLHSTRKSIINFKFYYLDPDNDRESYILEKTMTVAVTIDARSFLTKWGDFLLDDPKTTLTAILIPIFTFIGGFFSGKKKRKPGPPAGGGQPTV